MLNSFKFDASLKLSGHDWDSVVDEGMISNEHSKLIGSRITPYAYKKLMILPQTFKFLLLVSQQQFCHTPIFLFNSANLSMELQQDKAKRRKYEKYFQTIKEHMTTNSRIQQMQASGELSREHPLLSNNCFLFPTIGDEQKAQGYYTYYKLEDPDELGTECIVVYYHKSLKKCVIIIAQPKVYTIWKMVTDHIILTSTVLPFHKDCSFCGRCAENLTTCNDCKVARYCNRTCQTSHWKDHKIVCQRRKMKLIQLATVKSSMLSRIHFLLWKQQVTSSLRLQEMESVQAAKCGSGSQIADAGEEV